MDLYRIYSIKDLTNLYEIYTLILSKNLSKNVLITNKSALFLLRLGGFCQPWRVVLLPHVGRALVAARCAYKQIFVSGTKISFKG